MNNITTFDEDSIMEISLNSTFEDFECSFIGETTGNLSDLLNEKLTWESTRENRRGEKILNSEYKCIESLCKKMITKIKTLK